MQIQNFLITEWRDDLSKISVCWLLFPSMAFFFPSMNSNIFASVFPSSMLSYTKTSKWNYMKVSGRFASCLLTGLYLSLTATTTYWFEQPLSAHTWNSLDYRKSPKLAFQELHNMSFSITDRRKHYHQLPWLLGFVHCWATGDHVCSNWGKVSGTRQYAAPATDYFYHPKGVPFPQPGWVLLYLSCTESGAFMEETFIIKKYFTLTAIYIPWSSQLLTFSWIN